MSNSFTNSGTGSVEDEELERKLSRLIYKTTNQEYGSKKSEGTCSLNSVEVEKGFGITGKFTDVIVGLCSICCTLGCTKMPA